VKTISIVALLACLLSINVPARATLHVSYLKQNAGAFDVYQIQLLNDGLGGTGTKLAAFDVTLTPDWATDFLRIDFRDTDGDGAPDANITGKDLAFGSSSGSFFRIGADVSHFVLVAVDPVAYNTDPLGWGEPNQVLDPNYDDLKSLRVTGFYVNVASIGIPANIAPVSFGNVVVPAGASFSIVGSVGSEASAHIPFTASFPEPTAAMIVACALLFEMGQCRFARSRRLGWQCR
jgi:hypothetical protein